MFLQIIYEHTEYSKSESYKKNRTDSLSTNISGGEHVKALAAAVMSHKRCCLQLMAKGNHVTPATRTSGQWTEHARPEPKLSILFSISLQRHVGAFGGLGTPLLTKLHAYTMHCHETFAGTILVTGNSYPAKPHSDFFYTQLGIKTVKGRHILQVSI